MDGTMDEGYFPHTKVRQPMLTLGLILDCDGTIAPNTSRQLVDWIGIDGDRFWHEVDAQEKNGWDSALVLIPKLIKEARKNGTVLTRTVLSSLARNHLQFSKGVPGVFIGLTRFVNRKAAELHLTAAQEVHVITGGLVDLLVASALPSRVKEIWGCTLNFSDGGVALGPKSVVSFTEKTKYLFAVNKGISRADLRAKPALVNSYQPLNARPIPLDRMIYVGDGPTDIHCFSVVIRGGGQTLGITRPGERRDPLDYRPRWGPYSLNWTSRSDLVAAVKDRLEDILVRSFSA